MIVLDTNVLSELLRPEPERRVIKWLDGQPRASVFTNAVTQGEFLYGIRLLPDGNAAKNCGMRRSKYLPKILSGHVLSFDGDACGSLRRNRRVAAHCRAPDQSV